MGFEIENESEKRGKTVQELINESQRDVGQGKKKSHERARALLQKISGKQEGGGKAGILSATAAIKGLNQSLLPRYIMKLEEAAEVLDSYEAELNNLDKRLSKLSGPVKASLGGYEITEVTEQIKETQRRLRAHQNVTIKRLMG